jgi:hypothetical protein
MPRGSKKQREKNRQRDEYEAHVKEEQRVYREHYHQTEELMDQEGIQAPAVVLGAIAGTAIVFAITAPIGLGVLALAGTLMGAGLGRIVPLAVGAFIDKARVAGNRENAPPEPLPLAQNHWGDTMVPSNWQQLKSINGEFDQAARTQIAQSIGKGAAPALRRM